MPRKYIKITGAIILLFLGVELGIRSSGAIDFPTFHKDQEIGYMVKPSQSGVFLNRNSWAFNDKSMGTARAWNTRKPNILLIGNSVVMGGNPYGQTDKVGPLIEQNLSGDFLVWPIVSVQPPHIAPRAA